MPRPTPAPAVGYLLVGPRGSAAGTPGDAGADEAALLDALGAHSPQVEPDPPDGAWLDLRAGGRRGSDLAARAAAALAAARERGCAAARLGVAPTPGVARLAARHGPENPTLLAAGDVAGFLAPLPVGALELDGGLAERLALVGLTTLGRLTALPRGALGDYLGPAALPVEALARGEDARPLAPRRPPLVLAGRRDLAAPLDDRARLGALAGRLLAPLLAELRRRGLGATRATLALETGPGRSLEVAVALAAPATAPDAILGPLLAALPAGDAADVGDEDGAGGGVTAVALTLTAPRPPPGRQLSFYDVPAGREGRLRLGLQEARRRADGGLGYFRPADPAHALPERRYAFVEAAPDEGGDGAS